MASCPKLTIKKLKNPKAYNSEEKAMMLGFTFCKLFNSTKPDVGL